MRRSHTRLRVCELIPWEIKASLLQCPRAVCLRAGRRRQCFTHSCAVKTLGARWKTYLWKAGLASERVWCMVTQGPWCVVTGPVVHGDRGHELLGTMWLMSRKRSKYFVWGIDSENGTEVQGP